MTTSSPSASQPRILVIDDEALFREATTIALRISCGYHVDVEVLPGHTHTIRFQFHIEEPILPKPGTKFI